MPAIVSLHAVADEWGAIIGEAKSFINRETGEFRWFTREELGWVEEFEGTLDDLEDKDDRRIFEEGIEVLESDDFVELPGKEEIDEWGMMSDFCETVENRGRRERLEEAIQGSGAFRRFKDLIHRLDIAEDWYEFKQKELEKIVAKFLDKEGIAYR